MFYVMFIIIIEIKSIYFFKINYGLLFKYVYLIGLKFKMVLYIFLCGIINYLVYL